MNENKNYHSRLLELSKVFDDVIKEIKDSHIDEKYSNWFLWLLGSPLRDLKGLGEVSKGLRNVFDSVPLLSLFPIISIGIAPLLPSFEHMNFIESAIISFLISYVLILPLYFKKLIQFKSGHFHTGAYRRFRRQEYNLFKASLLDNKSDFYFRGLYDYIGIINANHHEFEKIYSMIEQRLERYLQSERHQLETKVSLLKDRLNRKGKELDETYNEYDRFIDSLLIEREELVEGIDFVIDLIKDINTVLFRIKNRLFSTKDLNLVSGFTLYELQGSNLVKLEDVGTTGSTPKILPLNSKRNWGALETIKSKEDKPVINTPYQNHTVVSYKMKMGISTEKVWVYNFHFDTDNKKAKHLLVKDDIIESREVYRLIHALCLLSQGNHLNNREAAE